MTRTRIPSLGPRGEGWLALQVALMVAIPFVAWLESLQSSHDAAGVGSLRGVGALVLIGGVVLIAWSSVVLRRANALSALPAPRDAATLVESGPYRVIRHPIYAGVILCATGIALIRLSVWLVLLALALAVVLDLKRRREDAWLTARYPGYGAYRARTSAFVPYLY